MTNRKLWKCKDGTKIRIKDMTDSHLQNAVNMLLRIAGAKQSDALSFYPDFNGEMAQFLAENEWYRLNEMTVEDFAEREIPIYKDMVAEIERREVANVG